MTGPLADLMYSVLPSTLSIVPATRWVCCCAHAVETANAAAKAAAAIIRIVLISDLPKGDMRGEHTPVSPDSEAGAEGASGSALWRIMSGGTLVRGRAAGAGRRRRGSGGAAALDRGAMSCHRVRKPQAAP